MSTLAPPAFASIDPAALAVVAGGASARSSSSAQFEDRLMDKMTSITTAIKDAATAQQSSKGADSMGALMPILAMKMMKQGQP